ncbi:nucleotidyltransferase domain-containing protein [Paenibacillus sp. PR3]|uniref:Nucleotidyltransferase domain-containing protein n=1 Tax=Paenibacillus terricola TaxID=2763503 RepID=A0ABR8MR53_9BACL|nr:nucleotidyltransferase domain-containing protein [Paenibacillus terricola]MBD3917295.1 nucleotidyltransferase domain-containing protein [Paenibacillus terricola]
MLDVFKVADALIDHIKQAFAEDIAIAAYYGSYAQGTATKRSDLDFFFIPASPRGYQASLQFIVDDISFDFWPISWERAERMASFQEPQTTIIADCKLLYVRSDTDLEQFMKLREKTSSMQAVEQELTMIQKAESELEKVYPHLYRMTRAGNTESITSYRIEASSVLTKVLQSLALLNRTYYTKGFGRNMEQIIRLPLKPIRLMPLMQTIMRSRSSAEMVTACEELVAETASLVLEQKARHHTEPSYETRMKGIYEEFKGVLDKIITACETNDYDTAYFAAVHVQEEIAHFIAYAGTGQWNSSLVSTSTVQQAYMQLDLPELIACLNPQDMTPLQRATERLSEQLEELLRSKGVRINRFADVGEFESYLRGRNSFS